MLFRLLVTLEGLCGELGGLVVPRQVKCCGRDIYTDKVERDFAMFGLRIELVMKEKGNATCPCTEIQYTQIAWQTRL